ncbi:hypothetical protein BDV29DRAFT_176243 [Aspergillus leporis]|uniref:Chitinase n=1 Tax=Aspergillus leporis TaxID=41062 RepID=A0A5N5WWZ1_9EURO|nr:hypothetical protein BDV29DRAFT_176243 [Aspergillus leporis]
MTYDIHGFWDSCNKNTGPYVRPHTNLTEIKLGLDLLWRNNVDPTMVNMGIGWYGRSSRYKILIAIGLVVSSSMAERLGSVPRHLADQWKLMLGYAYV